VEYIHRIPSQDWGNTFTVGNTFIGDSEGKYLNRGKYLYRTARGIPSQCGIPL